MNRVVCEWTEDHQACGARAEYLVCGGNKPVCEAHAAIVSMNNGAEYVQDLPADWPSNVPTCRAFINHAPEPKEGSPFGVEALRAAGQSEYGARK
jgi:hypothetical protein